MEDSNVERSGGLPRFPEDLHKVPKKPVSGDGRISNSEASKCVEEAASSAFASGAKAKEGVPVKSEKMEEPPSASELSKREPTESKRVRSEKYGNKAANLFGLEDISAVLRSEGIEVGVPKFHALSHKEVKKHLKRNYSGFGEDWKKFVKLQKEAPNGLSFEGKRQLSMIRKKIEEAFASSISLSGECEHEMSSPMREFLRSTEGLVMVRSTGREDTEEQALAGGNETVAGVERNIDAIFRAMGTVVASYFSEKSLTQRLLAQQDITVDPFMPVLLQEMIGEKPSADPEGDEVFCCGVAYTQEMGGETPDLTVVEAAYGHNEGVVNSAVSTDTYYVYPDGMNHEVIVSKPQRLVAQSTSTGKADFSKVDNPPEIVKRSVLSPQLQRNMQRVSKAIHDTYGQPMDIEWLYDPSKRMIYLVQARPIVRRITTRPSITNKEYLQENGTIYRGEMIVHRGGETIVLTQPEEVIQARDLDSALTKYLTLEQEHKERGGANPTRVVVVETMGSALSHPACVFRENGIVVICAKNFNASAVSQDTVALLDTQRGMIGLLKGPPLTEDELKKKGVIKEGWFKHPIPPVESLKDLEVSAEFLKALYDSIGLEGHKFSDAFRRDRSIFSLIEALGSEDIEKGNAAAKDLILVLYRAVKLLEPKGELGQDVLFNRGKTLLLNAMTISKDLLERTDPKQRLHAAKRLEALLTQEASIRILNTDSLTAILSEKKAARALRIPDITFSDTTKRNLRVLESHYRSIIKRGSGKRVETLLKNLSEPMTKEEMYTSLMSYQTIEVLAFSQETKKAWSSFSDAIASTESRTANRVLFEVIHDLEEMGILGEWMNSQFVAAYQQQEDPILLLENLRDEMREIRKFQKNIAFLKRSIDFWENNVGVFEDPNNFEQKWKQFYSEIVQPLQDISKKFCSEEFSLSPFEQRILFQTITNGVDVFDKGIKFLRGSPLGDPSQKAERFHTMLLHYRDLMLTWFDAIPEETFGDWVRNVVVAGGRNCQQYRDGMRGQITTAFQNIKTFSKEQFVPGPQFNVQAFCVNSGALFENLRKPNTLEDCFMLFHQNIIAGINCHKEHLPTSCLPEPLQAVLTEIEKLNTTITHDKEYLIKGQILNQEIDYPLITTTYNIPIKYHSVVVRVTYDCRTEESTINFKMFGHNFGRRMDENAHAVLIESLIHQFEFSEYPSYDEGTETLQFTWRVSKERSGTSLEGMQNMIIKAVRNSLVGSFGAITYPNIAELEKKQPGVWKQLIENPEILAHMIKSPFSWEVYAIVLHAINNYPQYAISLLPSIGIHLSDEGEEDLFQSLAKYFCDLLVNNKMDAEIVGTMQQSKGSIAYYWSLDPADLVKKGLTSILDDEETGPQFGSQFWQRILENKKALLYDSKQEFFNTRFYPFLIGKLVSYLNEHNMTKEMSECVQFLKENQQFEGLFRFYKAFKKRGETDEEFAHKAEVLLSVLKENGVSGVSATEKTVETAQNRKLQPGDRVIVKNDEAGVNWSYGRVLAIKKNTRDETIFLVECPVSRYGGIIIVDNPEDVRFIDKTSPNPHAFTRTLNPDQDRTAKKGEKLI